MVKLSETKNMEIWMDDTGMYFLSIGCNGITVNLNEDELAELKSLLCECARER